MAESVTVTAASPLLETETSSSGQILPGDELTKMPINEKRTGQMLLMRLIPLSFWKRNCMSFPIDAVVVRYFGFMNSKFRFKFWSSFILTAAVSIFNNSLFAADEFGLPSKDSPEVQWWRDSRTNLYERLAWFRDARFGMFIHWGVYSGLGNEFEGRKGGGYAEHIQRVLKIPIPVYRAKVAGNFNPTNFNADAWVALAKQAGMKYIVITSKHHDGFAMWPTKVNDYNIMDATPWH